MPGRAQSTTPPEERAFLVGLELSGQPHLLGIEDSLEELALLADTAGLTVVGETYQRLPRPDPATFIGSGKVKDVKDFVEETLATAVIFDDELSPRHQRELEEVFGEQVKVLDRTTLILDIFAQHARTREGALQVELAQYQYRLPRLTRAWTHLARQAGGGAGRSGNGGVGLRGPGETQLEADRREIGRKISFLKKELEKVRAHRQRHRKQRQQAAIPVVAIVGYTNAGKSTLLNALTGQEAVYTADQLFATLDPTTRRVTLPHKRPVLFTDTVGFIQKLPTTLVASFRATLEEISEADLILHVVDVTHPNARQHIEAVDEVLTDLNTHDVPVLLAFNKMDGLTVESRSDVDDRLGDVLPEGMLISARTGDGLTDLLGEVEAALYADLEPIDVTIPYTEGQLIAMFHEQGFVESLDHLEHGVRLRGRVPERVALRLRAADLPAKRKPARARAGKAG